MVFSFRGETFTVESDLTINRSGVQFFSLGVEVILERRSGVFVKLSLQVT